MAQDRALLLLCLLARGAAAMRHTTLISAIVVGASSPLAAGQKATRPCTDNDWQFGYSVCEETKIKDVALRYRNVFAYAPEGVCDPAGPRSRPLPQAITGLPCRQVCEAGTKLTIVGKKQRGDTALALATGCQPCEPGRYSLGGGIVIDGSHNDWAKPWPVGLETMCFYRGADYQWNTGDTPPRVCMLDLVGDEADPIWSAETLSGTWNAFLDDASLDLPFVAMSGDELACDHIQSTADFQGKAVLVLRGSCYFSNKTYNLAQAGALAVVLYNNVPDAPHFTPAASKSSEVPPIPIFMITREAGLVWKSKITSGKSFRLQIPSTRCNEPAMQDLPAEPVTTYGGDKSASENAPKTYGCSYWKAERSGQYIFSGDNTMHDLMETVLAFSVVLVREGHVAFRYRVDSEAGYDGMVFYVNDQKYIEYVSQTGPYKEFYLILPAGRQELLWVYMKDEQGLGGADRAELRFLEVNGTDNSDLQCWPCSDNAFQRCTNCGLDEYFDATSGAQSHCRACPPGRWAFPGSVGLAACNERRPCYQHDIEVTYSGGSEDGVDCFENRSHVVYSYRLPMTCNPTIPNSVKLPEPPERMDACPPCQDHESRGANGGACKPIDMICPLGTHGVLDISVTRWDTWPRNFSTETIGLTFEHDLSESLPETESERAEHTDPLRRGWQLQADGKAAVVGAAFGVPLSTPELEARVQAAMLHFDFEMENEDSFGFDVEFKGVTQTQVFGSGAGAVSWVQLNGTSTTLVSSHTSLVPNSAHLFKLDLKLENEPLGLFHGKIFLPPGRHRITWTWRYDTLGQHRRLALDSSGGSVLPVEPEPTGLRLSSVFAGHVVGGGFTHCHPCHAGTGFDLVSQMCKDCEAGESTTDYTTVDVSLGASGKCFKCPPGRIAPSPGSVECTACGPGLTSSAYLYSCVPDKTVDMMNKEWDLYALEKSWRDNALPNNSIGDVLWPFHVEGRLFYISPFHSVFDDFVSFSDEFERPVYWLEKAVIPRMTFCEGEDSANDMNVVADTLLSLEPTPATSGPDGDLGGVWAKYSGPCSDDAVDDAGDEFSKPVRISYIYFQCDPGTDGHDPKDLHLSFYPPSVTPPPPGACGQLEITWKTRAACPMCRAEDWVAVEASQCQNGKRRVVYLNPTTCFGGVGQPDDKVEACGPPLVVRFLVAIIGIIAGLCMCLSFTYVMLLRRRYAKYMTLEKAALESEQQSGVVPEGIGANQLPSFP